MTQEELNKLANEFYDHLSSQKCFYEVWPSEDDTICVDVDWGDWKKDHIRLDHVAKDYFESKGYDVINMDAEVTDEDGSDTYSATHSYRLRKHVEEPKEESLNEEETNSKVRLENPKLVSWKEMYLNDVCGGDEEEYEELYADMYEDDEFEDTACQAFFDVVDDKNNYLGKLGVYKFDMEAWTYEVGFEPNEQYLNKDKLELEDLDLPVDGWFDEKYTNEDIRSEEEYRELAKQFLPKIENAIEYSNDDLED